MSAQLKVRVVTDSTADIPQEVAAELGITVVPLYVHFGEQIYRDRVDLTTEEFYKKLFSHKVLPKTSAPSPDTFRQVYSRLSQESEAVISIHISPKLSATMESARLGSQDVDCPVSIVDSQGACMGCGLLVIMAAKAAADGATLKEVTELVTDAVPRTTFFGLVDTLEYLYKGGRIGKAQAFLGALLRIKPIIKVMDGHVLPVKRVRSRLKGINHIYEMVQKFGTISDMAIVHNTTPEEADNLAQQLSPLFPAERMYRAIFGPVMGTYVGPGALGVALITDKKII